VLEHLDRDDAVEAPRERERVRVGGADLEALAQSAAIADRLDPLALGSRVGDCDTRTFG